MNAELKIWTARIGYGSLDDELVLDTTAKAEDGPGKVFAPPWSLVLASKRGIITWEEYTERYLKLLRGRYKTNAKRFAEVCNAGEVVLLCYCANSVHGDRHCHRYLLADVLLQVAKSLGINAKYMGERLKRLK